MCCLVHQLPSAVHTAAGSQEYSCQTAAGLQLDRMNQKTPIYAHNNFYIVTCLYELVLYAVLLEQLLQVVYHLGMHHGAEVHRSLVLIVLGLIPEQNKTKRNGYNAGDNEKS